MIGRLAAMVWRAVVDSVDDSQPLQRIKLGGMLGGGRTAVRLQQYGFTSVPRKGSEVIVLQADGDASHLVVVTSDSSEHRPTGLEEGEVCLWHDGGASLIFKNSGDVVVRPKAGRKIKLDDGSDPVARKSDLQAMVTKFNSHTHSSSCSAGGAVTSALDPSNTMTTPSCSSTVETS